MIQLYYYYIYFWLFLSIIVNTAEDSSALDFSV